VAAVLERTIEAGTAVAVPAGVSAVAPAAAGAVDTLMSFASAYRSEPPCLLRNLVRKRRNLVALVDAALGRGFEVGAAAANEPAENIDTVACCSLR